MVNNKAETESYSSSDILSYDEIKDCLESVITDNDLQALNGHTVDNIVESLSYLAPFANTPASFDLNAFAFCSELDMVTAKIILGIAVKAKILQEKNGRYLIEENISKSLLSLLQG